MTDEERKDRKLTLEQSAQIEAEMRRLEDDGLVTKHELRLFMQLPMPCGHAVGNLMTCSEPPNGCVICGEPTLIMSRLKEPTDEEREEMVDTLEQLWDTDSDGIPLCEDKFDAIRALIQGEKRTVTRGWIKRWADEMAVATISDRVNVYKNIIESMLAELGLEVTE